MKKGEKFIFLIVLFVGALFMGDLVSSEDVPTSVNVIYSENPPVLVDDIPDFTWVYNTNKTNAFDLDNYFIDNETLSFSASSVQNISVVINESTHVVSFYPDIGFIGVRNVVFTADDGFGSADSNSVQLNVTNDTRAPTWSSLAKSLVQIYQSSVVRFSANWADDLGLSHYILAIKQQSGWVNQSPTYFSGTSNSSSYSIQISAPYGTNVEWYYIGYDLGGNSNMTSVSNFTVLASAAPPSSSDDEESSESNPQTTSSPTTPTESRASYTIDPATSFKIDLLTGGSTSITIRITNDGNVALVLRLSAIGLDGFDVIFSDELIELAPGESRTITIDLTAGENLLPDIYYGKIKIGSSDAGDREIPIAISVNRLESELGVSVGIWDDYRTVRPGEEVKANITLSHLRDVLSVNLTLYYAITDFEGIVIDSSTEEFVLNSRSAELEKTLNVPEGVEKGDYIFLARVLSGRDAKIASDIFEVGERFTVEAFIRDNILIIFLIIASILAAMLMVKHHKNQERLRLLNLYLMISEMNKLLKKGKFEDAIEVYVRIKTYYGEPVSRTTLENKDEIKREMNEMSEKFGVQIVKKLEDEKEKRDSEEKVRQEEKKVAEKKEGDGDKKEVEQKKINDDKEVFVKDETKTDSK